MKHISNFVPGLIALVTLGLVTAGTCGAQGTYHFLKENSHSRDGGWDYLSVDPSTSHLYMSHGTEVVVIDLGTDTIIGKITNTPGVHGVAIAPELGRGFVSDGRENKASIVDIVDLKTLQNPFKGGHWPEPGRNGL